MRNHSDLKNALFAVNPKFACETIVQEFLNRWGKSAAQRFFQFSGMTFFAPDRRGQFAYEFTNKEGVKVQVVAYL